MTEPAVNQVFGAGASQTTSNLSVNKADFATLTPSATNTAESMVVAFLLLWESVLTKTAQDGNPDQSIRIERQTENIASTYNEDNTITQWKEYPFVITLRQPYVAPTINPNEY